MVRPLNDNRLLQENELIINDFIRADKFNLDGFIAASLTDLNRLKNVIAANEFEVASFLNLNSFLDAEIKHSSYCFINMDDAISIDETISLRLFRKVRGKVKVIMFNETKCNLEDVEFYKYINWMRLIVL